jgi:hypothetical protein
LGLGGLDSLTVMVCWGVGAARENCDVRNLRTCCRIEERVCVCLLYEKKSKKESIARFEIVFVPIYCRNLN